MTHRRWADYRSELELLGFLELVKRGMGKGRGWEYQLRIPNTYDISLVIKFIKQEIAKDLVDIGKLDELISFLAKPKS